MRLFLTLPIIIIFLALLTNNVICKNSNKKNKFSYNTKLASQSFDYYINDTVNPCEDFYTFACGKMNGKRKLNTDSDGRVKIIQSEYYFRDFYQGNIFIMNYF